jgi:hypothetical protein
MKNRVVPIALTALAAVALGCSGTATTTPAQVPEGRINVNGANGTFADTNQQPNSLTLGGSAHQAVTPNVQAGTSSLPAAASQASVSGGATANGTLAATVPVQGTVPTKATGGVAIGGAAIGTDHAGKTVLLAPGELLPQPGIVRLTDPASPSPSPSATPSPLPSTASNSTQGITQPAASSLPIAAPQFVAVRNFSLNAAVQVLDFNHVVAIDGSSLYASSDGGQNWIVYDGVGRQSLRCLSFSDVNTGWVAGDGGTLLQIAIVNGTLSYQVKNSGTAWPIDALYYGPQIPTLPNAATAVVVPGATIPATPVPTTFPGSLSSLYIADETAGVVRLSPDKGTTWIRAVGDGVTVPVTRRSALRPDGTGGVAYLPTDPIVTGGVYTNIFRVGSNGFFGSVTANKSQSFTTVAQAATVAYFVDNTQPIPQWFSTSDWKNFNAFSADLLTPTQIIRNGLVAAFPIDATTVLGETADGKLALSSDAGHTWTEPVTPNHTPTWMWPFSSTQIWGYDHARGTLYRTNP